MDTLPIAVDDVKKEIVSLIEKKGLDTLTSATIRAHLKEVFDKDFTEYKKVVDGITRRIIEEKQTVSDSDSDVSDINGGKKEDTPQPTNSAESSDSDDEVLSTERARPAKKTRKRKAPEEAENENLDLISSVKSGRRTAAKQAANKLRKAAGWSARRKEATSDSKKEKGKITKGTKLVYVSEELQEITGQKFMRRCDVVKECWRYVRENNRIDPKDRRFALVEGDSAMEKIFKGKKRIQMFGVMSHLSHRHLLKPDDVSPELVEECEEYRNQLMSEWEASRSALVDHSNDNSENEQTLDTTETENALKDSQEAKNAEAV